MSAFDRNDNASRSASWPGYRECSPFILPVVPFGLLFGTVSSDAGLNLVETVTVATRVVAGMSGLYRMEVCQGRRHVR